MTLKVDAKFETACHFLFETNKKRRIEARGYLKDVTQSLEFLPEINEQERYKFPNSYKVINQLKLAEKGEFSYALDCSKIAEIKTTDYIPQPEVQLADKIDPAKSAYIAMMAHAVQDESGVSLLRLQRQIELLKEEGFGETKYDSLAESANRLTIVLGCNAFYSLNPQKNRKIRAIFTEIATLTNNRTHLHPFLLEPHFINKQASNTSVDIKEVKRFYRLLLDSKPSLTQNLDPLIMKRDEVLKIIPMQLIRHAILRSCYVSGSINEYAQANPEGNVCLLVCDDDADSLRTEPEIGSEKAIGLFSHYDSMLKDFPHMILGSTGYTMRDPMNFIYAASMADRMGRIALGPFAYLPEPNLLIRLPRNPLDFYRTLTFIRKDSHYKGRALEFIGLLECLKLDYISASGKIIMGIRGAIVTAGPRIKSHSHKNVNSDDFYKSETIRSFRSFLQTCIDPAKLAANILRLMPGMGGQSNNGLVSKILTLFDPITHSIEFPDCWYYTFRAAIDILRIGLYEVTAKPHGTYDYHTAVNKLALDQGLTPPEKEKYLHFFISKTKSFLEIRQEMADRGFTIQHRKIIYQKAYSIGIVIHSFIESLICEYDFNVEDFADKQ